jgi:hypothetical protein
MGVLHHGINMYGNQHITIRDSDVLGVFISLCRLLAQNNFLDVLEPSTLIRQNKTPDPPDLENLMVFLFQSTL